MAGDLIVDKVAATSTATKTSLMSGLAKLWARFNGTGAAALAGSFNVASLTDNGVGSYAVNMTAAMGTTNYGAPNACGATSLGSTVNTFSNSVSQVTVFDYSGANAAEDNGYNVLSVFGDLA